MRQCIFPPIYYIQMKEEFKETIATSENDNDDGEDK